jgi:hypothetical protein
MVPSHPSGRQRAAVLGPAREASGPASRAGSMSVRPLRAEAPMTLVDGPATAFGVIDLGEPG